MYACCSTHRWMIVQTCADIDEQSILDDVRKTNISEDQDDQDDEESDETPVPQGPMLQSVFKACETLVTFIECTGNGDKVLPAMLKVDKFVSKVHMSTYQTRQTLIDDFCLQLLLIIFFINLSFSPTFWPR